MNYQSFKNKLKECKLNIKEFANLTGLHEKSISANWKQADSIPKWAETWLDNYQKAKIVDDITTKFCPNNSNNSK